MKKMFFQKSTMLVNRFFFVFLITGSLSCEKPQTSLNAETISGSEKNLTKIASDTTLVTSVTELNAALIAATAGHVIILKDGNWSNAVLNLNATGGTSSAPIVVKAQTSNNVVLSNTSKIIFAQPYIIADGFRFANGSVGNNGDCVVRFNSDHCILKNTSIVDYNPPSTSTDNYWIYFDGNYNQVNRCFFTGKNNERPVIGNDGSGARYNKVDYCYIKNIPYSNVNGREIFRIWGYGNGGELGTDGAFFTIENNLLDQADGEGVEIISLKSNRNIVRYNTIRNTRGGIVLRGGNFNTIENNFILANNAAGSTGIRVSGEGHRVVNNYIANVQNGGLVLRTGEYTEGNLTPNWVPTLQNGKRVPVYAQVKDGVFANNTFVNNVGIDLEIGDSYKNSWSTKQLVLIPENNKIQNNLIYKSNGTVSVRTPVVDTNPPLNIFSFQPNIVQSNLLYGGTISSNYTPTSTQIRIANPSLSLAADGLYRISSASTAINGGVTVSGLTDDMDGQNRSGTPDIGADEYYSSGTAITHKPSTPTDVGPVLQIGMYGGCSYGGWAAGFEIGSYTISDIIARGGLNDGASSIRVPAGLKVTLYEGNNFTGASIVLTSNDDCLTDNSFNDKVSSLIVSAL